MAGVIFIVWLQLLVWSSLLSSFSIPWWPHLINSWKEEGCLCQGASLTDGSFQGVHSGLWVEPQLQAAVFSLRAYRQVALLKPSLHAWLGNVKCCTERQGANQHFSRLVCTALWWAKELQMQVLSGKSGINAKHSCVSSKREMNKSNPP